MTPTDRPRLKSVQPLSNHRLLLTFTDNQRIVRDMSNDVDRWPGLLLLKDPQTFATARVGDDGWTVEWSSVDIQIGADTLIGS
ncbi:DUF2442 domain-containing protein [Pseudomonas sp. NPDC090201]|uniref:DUF2442 domain-containing protein n=1 Tax=Pseudomonas sp. NPDC090201 TaxID=3364475 RepID=UPI00380E61A5